MGKDDVLLEDLRQIKCEKNLCLELTKYITFLCVEILLLIFFISYSHEKAENKDNEKQT